MFVTLTSVLGALAMAAVCLYALARGRWPERLGASTLALNWVSCEAVDQWHPATTTQPYIFGIDCAYDLLLLVLALRTNRIWTVGALAFQTFIVATHVATIFDPLLDRLGFFSIYYSLSYGVLASLALGTRFEAREPARARDPG